MLKSKFVLRGPFWEGKWMGPYFTKIFMPNYNMGIDFRLIGMLNSDVQKQF